jgi:hypothetical protein
MIEGRVVNNMADLLAASDERSSQMMEQIQEHAFRQANPVIPIFESIKAYVEQFEQTLDDQHEVCVRLASFGGEVTFHAERIEFSAPNVITFFGVDSDGQRVQLIQHVNQLSFLLRAAKKQKEKARRIGFT